MVRFVLLLFSLCYATESYGQETIDFGQYHALVIGNNEYEHLSDLRTAVPDAEAVAKVLEDKYRFQVTLLRNAKRATIIEAMNELTSRLTENDNLLVYYAGHGTLDKHTDTGYWQPVDARPDSDTFWIPTSDISRYLTRMNAHHVMVIADSCYAGALLTRGEEPQLPVGEAPETWLQRILKQGSRTALTSGWLEPVQDSGSGGHSVFADVLLKILVENDSILDGHSLFQQVKRPVTTRAAGSEQLPQYADIKSIKHEGGDFLLVPNDVELTAITPSKLPDWIYRGGGDPGVVSHCAKPTTPVLIQPKEGGIQPNHFYGEGEPWGFSWLESSCEGGTIKSYQIVVKAEGAATTAVDELVDEPRYVDDTSGTVTARQWTWKVRALDDKNQYSDWSEVRRFSVPPWDAIDIGPKREKVNLESNRITMEPGTGFIFSSSEVSSGVGSERDIWWNGAELVPGRRMCAIGLVEAVDLIPDVSARCVLKFAGFVPQENEAFLLEIFSEGRKQFVALRATGVRNAARTVTLEWLYPYSP
jgi:hypothetical protein